MFNLGNLLTSALLTTGVATATPVYNAENINNYSLNLNQTYIGYIESNNEWVNTDLIFGKINDRRYNIVNGNAYINVVGNQYETKVYNSNKNPVTDLFFVKNYNYRDNLNDSYPCDQSVIILKITPYNYNINTNLNIRLQVNYETTYNSQPDYYTYVNYAYMYRGVYTTTQSNWDQYIDKQLIKNTTANVINEITDVNNNFYYTYEENYRQIADAEDIDVNYTDEININIVPNIDNYIIIEYAPMINGWLIDNQIRKDNMENLPMSEGLLTIDNFTIEGTNIIPSGSYEVVDIGGLMWEILTMPFAFVSQAFNLTLFPGTPYQLNISNLFLSLVAIIAFVWLITFIIKMKG